MRGVSEMIVASAILKNGEIYTGKRHSDIFRDTLPLGCLKGDDSIQGFVTDKGKFLNRIEAGQHVLKCGQIKELRCDNQLYSEDLW